MLAYNVAASKMARPTCRFLSSKRNMTAHILIGNKGRMRQEIWTMQPKITRASVMGFFVAVAMHKEQ